MEFEVDNSAIHTPKWSKEMQGLAHLPDNQSLNELWKHSSKFWLNVNSWGGKL